MEKRLKLCENEKVRMDRELLEKSIKKKEAKVWEEVEKKTKSLLVEMFTTTDFDVIS